MFYYRTIRPIIEPPRADRVAENKFFQSPIDKVVEEAKGYRLPSLDSAAPRSDAQSLRSNGLLPPSSIQPIFEEASATYGVPLNVLAALAQQESSYNDLAIGPSTKWGRAKGIMQYLDSTAKGLGINPFDPRESIPAAARQLRERLDKGYTLEEAIMAHHGGDNRKQWGEKTRAYAQQVLGKAGKIGEGLMASRPAQEVDLDALQAELDAKEPGRYRVLSPAQAAAMQGRERLINDPLGAAIDGFTKTPAPSPLTIENQQAATRTPQAPSPLSPENQRRVQMGLQPKDTRPYQGFLEATGSALSNVPERFQQSIAGLIQMAGEDMGRDRERYIADRARQYGITPGDMKLLAWAGNMQLIDPKTPIPQALEYVKKNIAPSLNEQQLKELSAAGIINPDEITAYAKQWREDTKKTMAEVRPEPGSMAYYGSAAIGSIAEMAPMIAGAILTRSPAVATGIMSGQVGGQSYAEAREKGLSEEQAQTYAVLTAAAEAAPEALVVGRLLKPGAGVAKKILEGTVLEGAQEAVTAALQAGIDQQMIEPDMTLKEALVRIRDGAIVGAMVGGGMGGAFATADAIANRGKRQQAGPSAPQAEPRSATPAAATSDTTPQSEAQATPAAPVPEQVAPAPVNDNAAPEAPQPPRGPLSRAAERAVQSEGAERVRVQTPIGEIAGTMESFEQDTKGGWQARILGDDGQFYQYTDKDGVQIAPEAAVVGEAAAPQDMPEPAAIEADEAAPADTNMDLSKRGIQDVAGEPTETSAETVRDDRSGGDRPEERGAAGEVPAGDGQAAGAAVQRLDAPVNAPKREELRYEDMTEAELRERLKYLAQQAKTNGGWDKLLLAERKKVENAINARVAEREAKQQAASQAPVKEETPATPEPQAEQQAADQKPVKWFGTREKADAFIAKKGLTASHEVVQTGKVRFEVKPKAPQATPSKRQTAKQEADAARQRARDTIGAAEGMDTTGRSLDEQIADAIANAEALQKLIAQANDKTRADIDAIRQEAVDAARRGDPRDPPSRYGAVYRGVWERFYDEESRLNPAPINADKPEAASKSPLEVPRGTRAARVEEVLEVTADGKIESRKRVTQLEVTEPAKPKKKPNQTAATQQAGPAPSPAPEQVPAEASQPADDGAAQWNELTPAGRRAALKAAGVKLPDAVVWERISDANKQKLRPVVSNMLEHATEPQGAPAPSPAPAATQAEPAPASDAGKADPFAGNKLFTADKVAAARARLKSKLSQLNSGIDPEVLIDGMTIAGAYIEAGVRNFSDYAKQMTEDFGPKIKPYLLSFWEGARNYPGLDTTGMTSVEESAKLHAELNRELPKEEAKALGSEVKKPAKRTKKTGGKGDTTLTQDWGVDHIDGYGESYEREVGNSVKDQFMKDAAKYLGAVADILEEAGYVAHADAKGRPTKPVSKSEGGVAGSGDVTLTMRHPQTGVNVYVHVGESALRGVVPTTPSGIAVMFRSSSKEGDRHATGGTNRWAPTDLSAADLAAMITKEAGGSIPELSRPAVEAENDTQATEAGAGAEPAGAEPGRVQADEGDRPAGAVPGEPDGRVRAERGRRPAKRAERAGDEGQPGQGAGAEQPVRGDRARGAEPGGRADRSNYRIQPGELKRTGSWKATAEQNVRIVELVKQITAEGRQATPEEKALLTKFTGWGASEIANGIFPDQYGRYKDGWRELGERLEKALTPEEYAQAKRTTQYAHYTSEPIIRSIYNALGRMGFNGGQVLEPGMGIGLFNGLMPDSMVPHSTYTGVEYDSITGNIAKLLYPESNIVVGDFTQTKLPRDFFDAAIGNPPFGQIKIQADPEYRKHNFLLHDYFFAKTIDRVKPGGLLVFVTSKGTMDKANDRARKYLAERADLVGAIRLPQTAFKDNAGTEVVTDVIFLRKRAEGQEPAGEAWAGLAEVQTPQGPAMVNEYFAAHPEMVLGRHAKTGSMYRADEYTVEPIEGDIEELFAKAVQNLPENIYRPERGSQAEAAAVQQRDYDPKVKKEGGVYVADDGTLMQVESGQGVPLKTRLGSNGKELELKPREVEWLKGYTAVRDALKQAQYDQLNDGPWEKSLKALNKAYDAFVKKHGPILAHSVTERENDDGSVTVTRRFKNEPLLRLDAEGALAYALEVINEDGTISKGAVLKGRILNKPAAPEIATVQDALFVSLNNRGRLDIDEIASLSGQDRDAVIAELGTLIYEDPASGWTMADEYLSGNVVRKLKEAEAAARLDKRFARNVEALKNVQPRALAPADITVQLGSAWVPASDVANFAAEQLGESMQVSYSPVTGQWNVEGGYGRSVSEWGYKNWTPADILEGVLNNKTLKVTYRDQDGKTHTDAEGTEKVNDIAKKMRDAFKRWIWSDAKRADRLARHYNENYNNIVPPSYDGSHLTLPGVSSRFKLYPHQKRAIWRIVQQGDNYLAHSVGAGKTFTMIAAGMEERRLGLVKKPMYVVPNHMLAQFSKEFLELYPTAQIMVADETNFHTHNRRRFVAQAALNDPDAIIITHSAFGRIGMSPEFTQRFIQDQIDEWQDALEEADKGDRVTRKQIERRIEQLENRLKAAISGAKDNVLSFEELGVDRLYVDEMHEFRKLDFATNRGNVKGIDPSGSQRAMDLMMKVQYLRTKNPSRVIVGASGTPITNTMGELFTVQRIFQPNQLEEDGLSNFDAWSNQFGEVVDALEQNAAGGYESVSRFAKFVNVPELMSRVRSFMDILTSEQLGQLVQRPSVEQGGRQVVVTPSPDGYKAYQKTLEERIKAIRARRGPPKPGDDIILNVIADGRFSAIDMRFVDPSLPSDPNSKLNRVLDDMIEAYHRTAENEYETRGEVDPIKGSTLMLFTDIGLGEQSAKSRGFDMKAWIEKRLIEGGVKPEHIAFMRDHKAHAKKERLFEDLRQGRKRILIGGKDMETGVNAQKRLIELFHLDAPWFPASVEQREGRIIRQGNQNKQVRIRAYATKGSYDSTMWGMNARKARFIEQAMTGDSSVRAMEDVSEASAFEMAAALASGDERYLKLAGLKGDVERLGRLYAAHMDDQRRLRSEKMGAEASIKHSAEVIAQLKEAIAQRQPIKAGEFTGKVGGKTYDSREDFSNALFAKFKELAEGYTAGEQTIGEIGGFPVVYTGVEMRGGNFAADASLQIPGDPDPLIVFPIDPNASVTGIATRAANQVNGLDRELTKREESSQNMRRRLEQIESRLGAPFAELADLTEKQEALSALEAELEAESKAASAEAAAATAEVEGQTEATEDNAPRYSVQDGQVQAEFGPVIEAADAADAISKLKDAQTGEAIVVKPGIGEISLVYGNRSMGLAHIEARRGEAMLERLPDLIENGTVYTREGQNDRLFIGNDRDEAVIRLDWNSRAKTWLLTAYEKHPNLEVAGSVPRQGARSQVVAERAQRQAMTTDQVRQAITRGVNGKLIIDTMVAKGLIQIHPNTSTLPKELGRGKRGIQAVTAPDNRIHLVASNLTPQNANAVLLHEMFHSGVENLVGSKRWAELMGRLGSLYRQAERSSGKAREIFDRARTRVAYAKAQGAVATRMEVEEFGAYTIEEYESLPAGFRKWVDDLIGAIKAWLFSRYGMQLGNVTPAQLRALAKDALINVAMKRRGELFGKAAERFSYVKVTESPAFKRWFGDSKVVDENGEPLVVYHGTGSEFSIFSEDLADEAGVAGKGFYFTSSRDEASSYAERGDTPNVIAAYVSISNPLVIRAGRLPDGRSVIDVHRQYAPVTNKKGADEIRSIAEQNNNDGVIWLGNDGSVRHVVAFRPEQIKSATDNTGDFDPSNPDIRFSVLPDDTALEDATKALDEPAQYKPDFIGQLQQDIGRLAKILLHPRQIAALHKDFAPVYRAAIEQFEMRDSIIDEFQQDHKAYDVLPQKSKKRVNAVLELGRLLSTTYSEAKLREGVVNPGVKNVVKFTEGGSTYREKEKINALLSAEGEVIQLSEAEIQAYLGLRKMFDKALDKFKDQTLEDFGFPELVGQQKAAGEILAMIDATTPAEKAERLQNIARFIQEIEQAKRTGYVPFARYGDYVVAVKEQQFDLKLIHDPYSGGWIARDLPLPYQKLMDEIGAQWDELEGGYRLNRTQRQALMKENERTIHSAKVEFTARDRLMMKAGRPVEQLPSVKAALAEAEKWKAGDPNRRIVAFEVIQKKPEGGMKLSDVDALAEVAMLDNETWDAVRDQLADAIKGRSFRKHFFQADNVPGYTADFERAIADYMAGMAGYLSRRHYNSTWDNAIAAIKAPRLFDYANKYRAYANEPQEELAMLRQVGFFHYIAGVPATAFVNLTQPILMTIPALGQIASMPMVMREMTRAYKDALAMIRVNKRVGLDFFDPSKAPADIRPELVKSWGEGMFVPLQTYEVMATARQRNVGHRQAAKFFNRTIQVTASLFSFAERLNRLVTFIAAARLAKKPGVKARAMKVYGKNALARQTVLRNWSAESLADFMIDETQFRMGKANRPVIMRGVGAAIMQFKGFVMQSLEAWFRMATQNGKEGVKAVALSLGFMVLMGGLWGLPGADDLRDLIEKAYKQVTKQDLDLKTELRRFMYELTGQRWIAEVASKGATYPFGLDLSRVGMGGIAPDSPLQVFGIPADLIIGRGSRAFGKANEGDYYGAVAEFLPNFLKNPVTAYGWTQNGVRDGAGRLILDESEVGSGEVGMKSLGFQPSRITDIREYTYAQRRMETANDELKRDYASRLAKAIVKAEKYPDKAEEAMEEYDALLQELEDHNARFADRPEYQINITRQTLNQRIKREMGGAKQTWGRERKQARGAAADLREVFGLTEDVE